MKVGAGLDSPGKAAKLAKSGCSRITWDEDCNMDNVGKHIAVHIKLRIEVCKKKGETNSPSKHSCCCTARCACSSSMKHLNFQLKGEKTNFSHFVTHFKHKMYNKTPVGQKRVVEVAFCVFAEVVNVAQLWQPYKKHF